MVSLCFSVSFYVIRQTNIDISNVLKFLKVLNSLYPLIPPSYLSSLNDTRNKMSPTGNQPFPSSTDFLSLLDSIATFDAMVVTLYTS